MTLRKDTYTIDQLCELMEISRPTFRQIIREPGANFPRELNPFAKPGQTIHYPKEECDLWFANNYFGKSNGLSKNGPSLEDVLLLNSARRQGVGSVVELQNMAGTKQIQALLGVMRSPTLLKFFPAPHVLHYDKGWVPLYR